MKGISQYIQMVRDNPVSKLGVFVLFVAFAVTGCNQQNETNTSEQGDNVSLQVPDVASRLVQGNRFNNGQAAAFVVGQPDFTSAGAGAGPAGLNFPQSNVHSSGGNLYIADNLNNRILVFNSIPASNGASADFAIGQPDLVTTTSGTSSTALDAPLNPVISSGRLFVADQNNSRVAIYNTVPATSPGTIDVVAGQPDKVSSGGSCTATGLDFPEAVWAAGNRMVVADTGNNRVLIWNSIPTVDNTPADLVLGSGSFTICNLVAPSANSFDRPTGVWTDGTRLVVVDQTNSRVLIWNTFPTTNGQAADLVLGQTDFTSSGSNQGGAASAGTLSFPFAGVFVDNDQLFIADNGNNRVLIWNRFPTTNGQAADQVLGQANFTDTSSSTSQTTLDFPAGVFVSGTQLFISDVGNNRILIHNSRVGTLTATLSGCPEGNKLMTISGSTASATCSKVPEGPRTFTITFTYDLDPYGPLTIASASKQINVVKDRNNPLNFVTGDFDTASFDEDGDGISNILELDESSTSNPLLAPCVLGTSLLDDCELGS